MTCGLCEWQVSGRSTISISPLFSHAHGVQGFFFLFSPPAQCITNTVFNRVVFFPPEIHHLDKPHINLTSLQRNIKGSNAHICNVFPRTENAFLFLLKWRKYPMRNFLPDLYSPWKTSVQAKECRKATLDCVKNPLPRPPRHTPSVTQVEDTFWVEGSLRAAGLQR